MFEIIIDLPRLCLCGERGQRWHQSVCGCHAKRAKLKRGYGSTSPSLRGVRSAQKPNAGTDCLSFSWHAGRAKIKCGYKVSLSFFLRCEVRKTLVRVQLISLSSWQAKRANFQCWWPGNLGSDGMRGVPRNSGSNLKRLRPFAWGSICVVL